MSSTTSSAPISSSTNRVQQVEIPSSTVLAIGLGFVGFVAILLISSCGVRVLRVRRRLSANRAAGQTITFRQEWEREGGMFGFFSSFASGGALALGAGGTATERLEALMRGQRGWGAMSEKEVPLLWEVPIKEKADLAAGNEDDHAYQPFALSSTVAPKYIDRAKSIKDLPEPSFTLSLLIALPSEPTRESLTENKVVRAALSENGDEDWPDLPDLLIGTTQICPMIPDDSGPDSSADDPEQHTDMKSRGKDGNSIQELEYKPVGMRRARWERVETVKWQIEGLR